MTVIVTTLDFNIADEMEKLKSLDVNAGALVTFTGLARSEGENSSLTLECYEDMAIAELQRIESEAHKRWQLQGSLIIHRHGLFKPKDQIMMVATLSSHRKDAFEAAEFLMDFLKTDAPFWKKAVSDGKEHWVEAKTSDDDAKARWVK